MSTSSLLPCCATSRKTRDQSVLETGDGRSIQIVNQPLAHGGWVATQEDITERRAREADHPSGAYDALTDLPNRALFRGQLEA